MQNNYFPRFAKKKKKKKKSHPKNVSRNVLKGYRKTGR